MAAPVKVAFLVDATREGQSDYPLLQGLALKVAEANAAGGVWGRSVELVLSSEEGTAYRGLPENTRRAWKMLADQTEVIAIIGPGHSANVLPLVDLVERERVPTLHFAGTEKARGEWLFQFQADSLSDNPIYLVRLLAAHGRTRVGVLQTAGAEGDEYFEYFSREAQLAGIKVVAHEQVPHFMVSPGSEDVTAELEQIRESHPDAVVVLGFHGEQFLRSLRAMGWRVPRYGSIVAGAVVASADLLADNEGLLYWVDQYEPRNTVAQEVHRTYLDHYGVPAPEGVGLLWGYDMMTLMIEGMTRAPNLSRAGLKVGLERVHQVPCATGGLRPVMGFSPWDRQALKGYDMLMYRTVTGGRAISYDMERDRGGMVATLASDPTSRLDRS